jgi:catechol 2,3-dioxygenase-like lactoylglutathione lyase family enzyme
VRIRHIGMVVSDLDKSADFYSDVLGFRRLSGPRKPGEFPGTALDMSDGEVNFTLLQPREDVPRQLWSQGTYGPNHIGVTVEDTAKLADALRQRGIEVYGAEDADPPRFFKFHDLDGVEVDVATPDRSWTR